MSESESPTLTFSEVDPELGRREEDPRSLSPVRELSARISRDFEDPRNLFAMVRSLIAQRVDQGEEVDHVPVYDPERWTEQVPPEDRILYGVPVKNFSFKNVSFRIGEKQILHPMSGSFERGKLVAIMGPSGCGKSTLLDILSGKKPEDKYEGEVLLNGHARDGYFNRVCSYVSQEDIYNGLETVEEAIKFVSDLKADYGTPTDRAAVGLAPDSTAERKSHRELLLKLLGLHDLKDAYVGNSNTRGISGGQKRRLTLAKGLISGPVVAFLDEPTSGLSATDAELCIQCLRNITKVFGVLIFVVIHQPRYAVFKMFDDLLLLSAGRVVYNGPAMSAEKHFEKLGFALPLHENPADFFLDVVTPGAKGADPDTLTRHYEAYGALEDQAKVSALEKGDSIKGMLKERKGFSKRPHSVYVSSRLEQFRILFRRAMQLMCRDVETAVTVIGSSVVIGLAVGLTYLNVRNNEGVQFQLAFLFMVMITVSLTALNFVPLLVEETLVYKYERSELLYSALPFILAKSVPQLLIQGTANLILILMTYFMAGFGVSNLGYFLLSCLLGWFVSDGAMAVLAALSPNVIVAMSLSSVVFSVFALFNGFTANPSSMPPWLGWICYLSPFYYMFEGIVIELFENWDGYCDPTVDSCFGKYTSFDQIVDQYGLHAGNKWKVDILVLALMGVAFRLLTYVALKFFVKLKR